MNLARYFALNITRFKELHIDMVDCCNHSFNDGILMSILLPKPIIILRL